MHRCRKSIPDNTGPIYNSKLCKNNINYGFLVIKMCQCIFIDCNRCTTLVWGVIVGESVYVLAGSIWELYCQLTFAMNLKLL